jgi:uncharacterized protein YutE (UPF0331/DUF86 family)
VSDDITLAKVATIERCLAWIREDYAGDPRRLDQRVVEHAIVLNLQRACEAAIDAAMHLVAVRRLGLPQDSRDAFSLLEKAGVLDVEVADRMRRMVGFRNIAIHEYQKLSRLILEAILRERLVDFEALCGSLLRA